VEIVKRQVEVDMQTRSATISADEPGKIYIVTDGGIVEYPLPKYGRIEIPCQNYKIGKPKYTITAD